MSILLTSATGFMGSAIATNLAAKGLLADTRFVMRNNTPVGGLTRLRNSLRRFEFVSGILDAITKSQIVPFDLREAGAAGPGGPEIIINCAALVTLSNHPSLWETNVESVLALGRLATQDERLKRFMQIGTAMSYGQLANRHVSEGRSVPALRQHAVLYTYSKGIAELKLCETVPELPLVMVRPSIVVGHNALRYEPSDNIFWTLRMVAILETFSCRLSDHVDILPVDDCAKGIMQLAAKSTLIHDLYRASAGDANSERIKALHPRLKRCKASEEDAQALAGYMYQGRITEKALARKFLSLTSGGNIRLAARYIYLCAKFVGISYVFNDTRLMQETDFQSRSPLAYLDRCLETSDAVPIPEQMRWDYK